MPRNRLPRVMKHYLSTGRRNHDRCLKRLLDTWDRNGQQVAQLHDRYMMMMNQGVMVTFKACPLRQTFTEMVRVLDSSDISSIIGTHSTFWGALIIYSSLGGTGGVQGEVTWRSSKAKTTSPSQIPTSPSGGGPC